MKLLKALPKHLSFLYIGDLDPHGISIYLDYVKRTGLCIQWLGLKAQDIKLILKSSDLDDNVLGIKVGLKFNLHISISYR